MAIGIKVKKAPADHDIGASKFFGAPTIPMFWEGDFYESEMFLCQINLADIAPFDSEKRLPHTGYLYIFLHTDGGDYGFEADVRYFEGEPELAIDDFNLGVEGYEDFNDAYLMEFCEVGDSEACTRLLGVPSDWNYESQPPQLLLQFDPLDNEMGFLNHLDGFLYFFFGENKKDFEAVTLVEEYS